MPRYVASISEMLTMPVGVLTTDYIDVWCNTTTGTPHKILGCQLRWVAVKAKTQRVGLKIAFR